MVGVLSEDELAHELQLGCKDFITHQVGTEEGSVSVGEVVTLVECDVWEVAQLAVHVAVLPVRVVQPTSRVLVSLVLPHHLLQQLQLEVLSRVIRGRLEEHPYIDVVHFIIPNEHGGGREFSLMTILSW